MKKSRFSETQIISVLARHERGEKTRELCRELGISEATFYAWKAKYGGLSVSELKRIKELEAENARLKRMYADLSLVHEALKEAVRGKA
jgi:putative transposase